MCARRTLRTFVPSACDMHDCARRDHSFVLTSIWVAHAEKTQQGIRLPTAPRLILTSCPRPRVNGRRRACDDLPRILLPSLSPDRDKTRADFSTTPWLGASSPWPAAMAVRRPRGAANGAAAAVDASGPIAVAACRTSYCAVVASASAKELTSFAAVIVDIRRSVHRRRSAPSPSRRPPSLIGDDGFLMPRSVATPGSSTRPRFQRCSDFLSRFVLQCTNLFQRFRRQSPR
jgi:hypothetical protein